MHFHALNSSYTEFHFLEVFLRLLILSMICIHFCYELALETSVKCSSIKFLRVHDFCHAHPLARFTMVRALRPVSTFPNSNCLYSARNAAPKKAEEPYLHSLVSKKCLASAEQGFSTASQGSCHVHSNHLSGSGRLAGHTHTHALHISECVIVGI